MVLVLLARMVCFALFRAWSLAILFLALEIIEDGGFQLLLFITRFGSVV